MDLSKYADLFLSESREYLSAMNHHLLELEREPGAEEPVRAIFRAVHTVKGMSATMGYQAVADLAHELESVLDRVRRGEQTVTPALMDALFESADALELAVERSAKGEGEQLDLSALVERLRAIGLEDARAEGEPDEGAAGETSGNGPAPATAEVMGEQTARPTPSATRTVRIDLRRLDTLMNLMGELVIARGRLTELVAPIDDGAIGETMALASRLIGELQEEIMLCRMVPVGQVFDRYPRLVRDSARALGKDVAFTMVGNEIELDRSMLVEIGDPLVHLLRNAVDHGIETPEERVAAGKPARGSPTRSVARERSTVTIRVMDDGRGVNREKVLARARATGLVEASRTELSDDELVRLISRSGFTTAERVTDISGRGVGIDAVMNRVRSMGGAVEIRSKEGEGTTVTVRLPLTLAIVRALLARVRDEVYAVPMAHVTETVELVPQALRRVRGREVMTMRDDVLPLIRFDELVRLPPAGNDARQVIVLEVGERRAGLVVDELTGQQDIVVKQFDPVRDAVSLFSGATILSDGAPALIVDVGSLM
ncbi:MAG TPA: chemotaxis protein CheA [Gemmatimonadaceae bacterium]|nr:chemotaxis protein CheA [Gemmatimonadaceae bacterium]